MDNVLNRGASGRLPTLFDIVEGGTEGRGDAVWWGALTLMDPPPADDTTKWLPLTVTDDA